MRVALDLRENVPDSTNSGQIVVKELRYAPVVAGRRFHQYAEILNHSVGDDMLHDRVDKMDLTAVQVGIVEELRKSFLRGVLVQADDFAHEFP